MKEKILKLSKQLVNESTGSIEQLFHIAAMSENRNLAEMLSDMNYEDTLGIIPGLTVEEFNECYSTEMVYLYGEYGKNGYIAECHFNEPRYIEFNPDGRLRSFRQSGCSYVRYVYGDTMEELLSEIISIGESLLENDIQKERDKRGIQLTESNLKE